MDAESYPDQIKTNNLTSSPYYIDLRRWLIGYHYPFLDAKFGTSSPLLLDDNPDFIQFVSTLFTKRTRNATRREDDRMKAKKEEEEVIQELLVKLRSQHSRSPSVDSSSANWNTSKSTIGSVPDIRKSI